MRTSGTGNDMSMLIIPMGILIFFGVLMAGGPRETLFLLERTLEAIVGWVAGFFA